MRLKILAASVFVLTAVGCDQAAKALHGGSGPHQPAAQHAEQSGPTTVDIQGGYNEWRASPFIHQFYDLTQAAFANGADKVDFAAYQEKSYAIFRAFGGSTGGKAGEEAMLDHLKDIPRQMVGIVKDDPSVLESYDKFWIALSGPP
jgi:hypothetical protein